MKHVAIPVAVSMFLSCALVLAAAVVASSDIGLVKHTKKRKET